jgi:dienelactone hydrolase
VVVGALAVGLGGAADRARPAKNAPQTAIVFAPGDGGWRGFALDIGAAMASWGYDVYGVDTKRYLESFTSGKNTLNQQQIIGDMAAFGRWAGEGRTRKLVFVGWSEGAGLGVLALAAPGNRGIYQGLAAIGLPERAEMGWRWADNITYVTKKEPDEPMFATGPLLGSIAPAPFFLLQATGDEYTTPELARRMFAGARDPKRIQIIEARNHHFDGNHDAFFAALREGIAWIADEAH